MISEPDTAPTHEQDNSTTPVYLPITMWDGPRVTASFKCNGRLWEEWKTHSKQFYGSVCRPMEIMIATALGISNLKVYSGLTINIQNQHISREQRSRRKVDPVDEAPLVQLAGSFVEYYKDRPWLSPGSTQLYKDIGREHPDLSWGQRKSMATIILKKLKEMM